MTMRRLKFYPLLVLAFSLAASQQAHADLRQSFRYAKGLCGSFLMLTPDMPRDLDAIFVREPDPDKAAVTAAAFLKKHPELELKLVDYLKSVYQVVPFGVNKELYLNQGVLRAYRILMEYSSDLAAQVGNQLIALTAEWSARDGLIDLISTNLKRVTGDRKREFLHALANNEFAVADAVQLPSFGESLRRIIENSVAFDEATRPEPWDLFRLGYRRINADMAKLKTIRYAQDFRTDAAYLESKRSEVYSAFADAKRIADSLMYYFKGKGDVIFKIYFEQHGVEIEDFVHENFGYYRFSSP